MMKLVFIKDGVVLKELDPEQLTASTREHIDNQIAEEISNLFMFKKEAKKNKVLEILQRYTDVYVRDLWKALKKESIRIR